MSLKHKVNFLLFCFPQPTIPTDPPVVYHATVIAPQTFVEEDDVNELHKYLGKNSDSGLKSRIALHTTFRCMGISYSLLNFFIKIRTKPIVDGLYF